MQENIEKSYPLNYMSSKWIVQNAEQQEGK